jgi:hypothetical protein
MSKDLNFDIHHAVLPAALKGRITKPAVGAQDKAFVYVPAIKTDLAETFRRAREALGVRAVMRVETA